MRARPLKDDGARAALCRQQGTGLVCVCDSLAPEHRAPLLRRANCPPQVRGTGLLVGIQMKAAVTPVVEVRGQSASAAASLAAVGRFASAQPAFCSVPLCCVMSSWLTQARSSWLLSRLQDSRKRGLLIITAGAGDIVRLVPPLTITSDEVEKCATILAASINSVMK